MWINEYKCRSSTACIYIHYVYRSCKHVLYADHVDVWKYLHMMLMYKYICRSCTLRSHKTLNGCPTDQIATTRIRRKYARAEKSSHLSPVAYRSYDMMIKMFIETKETTRLLLRVPHHGVGPLQVILYT